MPIDVYAAERAALDKHTAMAGEPFDYDGHTVAGGNPYIGNFGQTAIKPTFGVGGKTIRLADSITLSKTQRAEAPIVGKQLVFRGRNFRVHDYTDDTNAWNLILMGANQIQ